MSKFTVTIKCVECTKATTAQADGDPKHGYTLDWPSGWQGVAQASVSAEEAFHALCPAHVKK